MFVIYLFVNTTERERVIYRNTFVYTNECTVIFDKKTTSPCTYDFYVKSHNYIRETKLSSENYSRLPYVWQCCR